MNNFHCKYLLITQLFAVGLFDGFRSYYLKPFSVTPQLFEEINDQWEQ